jgi:hypothetical protein
VNWAPLPGRTHSPTVRDAGPLRPRWTAPYPPDLPAEPYPLLWPYRDPRTFSGRDYDIDDFVRTVKEPPLVLCAFAPSGAGKSSLLHAGLAPRLRKEGYLVSVGRATPIVLNLDKSNIHGRANWKPRSTRRAARRNNTMRSIRTIG